MSVCLGERCIKRRECANYYLNNKSKANADILDWSTYGSGSANEEGIKVEFCCGDYGKYKLFKELKGE